MVRTKQSQLCQLIQVFWTYELVNTMAPF